MNYTAKGRYIHTTPRKIRLILDAIRGKSADHVESELQFVPKQAARDVLLTLKSAIASAKEKGIEKDQLKISQAICHEGPKLKRRLFASRGRSQLINKHQSHLYITLTDQKESQDGA